jgi:hypothetical protein
MALAKLADKHRHPDLAAVFRANLWRPPKK